MLPVETHAGMIRVHQFDKVEMVVVCRARGQHGLARPPGEVR